MPSTAVGEGEDPRGEGGAELATELAAAAGGVAEGGTEGEAVVALGGALCVTVADGFADAGDELGLAWLAAGLSAIDHVDDTANTAAPSAMRPTSTAIGTTPIRRPRGRKVRQLGQKPETGVKT